jgi:hypothetical protein
MKMSVRSLRMVFFTLVLGWSVSVQATTQYFQSTLQSVYPLADGSFVLIFSQSGSNCHSLNSPPYFYVAAGQNGVTADGVKGMLATALTAFSLGKTLAGAFDDSTPYCYVNRFSMQ